MYLTPATCKKQKWSGIRIPINLDPDVRRIRPKIVDALSRRRQLFCQVWYKSAVDCMRIDNQRNADKCPKIAYSSVVKKTSIALLSQGGRAIASIVKYLEHSLFFYIRLLVTSASYLPVRTIRFCSVIFGVTSNLAVIHTIRGRV